MNPRTRHSFFPMDRPLTSKSPAANSPPFHMLVRTADSRFRGGGGMKETSRGKFERIRRDSRDHALSVRALATRHGMHRRIARWALAGAVPPARKVSDRPAPGTGQHVDLVRRWLT